MRCPVATTDRSAAGMVRDTEVSVSTIREPGRATIVRAAEVTMQSTHMQAQKKVAGIHFPATRTRLIEFAERNGADAELLQCMRELPERVYDGPNEVGSAFAKVHRR
jgi:hypothetical protein